MTTSGFTVEGPNAPVGSVSAFALAEMAASGRLSGMQIRNADTGELLTEAEVLSFVQSVQLPPTITHAPVHRIDGNQDPMRFVAPIHASGWAVAAGYLGLFSVTLVFAPFSLVAGLLALKDLKAHPHKTGKGRAIFGLGMGIVFTVFLLVLLIGNIAR